MLKGFSFLAKCALVPCLASGLVLICVETGITAPSQQSNSLADAARQARAQKQVQPKAEISQAQQIADQLAEEQDNGGAPGGYKTYDAGGYRLWVPAPFTVAAHDDAGVILSGPQVGTTRTLVLVGTPIVSHWGNNDDAFRDAATQFTRLYAQSANCTKAENPDGYRCSVAGGVLAGHSVSGNAVFVHGTHSIAPVMCVAITSSAARDTYNSPRSDDRTKRYARLAMDREDADVKVAWAKCDVVLQSIQLREERAPQTASQAKPANDANHAPTTAAPGKSAPPADLTKNLHEASAVPLLVAAPAGTSAPPVPAGFKVQPLNYCKGGTQTCWDASIIIPEEAKLVSSACRQYVFEVKVQGEPFLLLAGARGADACSDRTPNDPSLIRWKELVLTEAERIPGTAATISTLQTTVDRKPAVITTMGFRKGMASWIGKREEVESHGVQLVVGCMAPREHFADGDAICSAMIDSLRLP